MANLTMFKPLKRVFRGEDLLGGVVGSAVAVVTDRPSLLPSSDPSVAPATRAQVSALAARLERLETLIRATLDPARSASHSTAVASTQRADEPKLVHQVAALLPTLPAPLRLLHGPLLATVETWSDGTVYAHLPAARLYGSGTDSAEALDDLAAEILSSAQHLSRLHREGKRFGGAAAKTWTALEALVDMSALGAGS
jgi:hypothetical protein